MSKLLHVSTSPHVLSKDSTHSIMLDVVLALIPAAAWGVYMFGYRAAIILALSMISAVACEYIWQKCMHLPITVNDYSALVTGLLLGMNLPSTGPYWLPVVGSAFAIIIVKQLFGGIGQNFMNPALAGRCFMMLSFSSAMTSFTVKKGAAYMYGVAVDATSSATPLAQVKEGGLPDLKAMFLGTTTGTIGETSVAALLIGAIYLLVKRIIDWKIPVVYILTFSVFDIVYQVAAGNAAYPLVYELCGGGLILGAFFMATDYVTSPITAKGKVIYGILLGLLTGLFRFFGESAEGVSFAIIIANVCVPLIERWTVPKPFGKEGKANE